MKNFCIFCGKGLIGGVCNCAEFIAYNNASAPAPAAPVYTPPVAPAPAAPVYTPPVAPAPASEPSAKPMDSHFQSAGDL